jgi:hypothetical protein
MNTQAADNQIQDFFGKAGALEAGAYFARISDLIGCCQRIYSRKSNR